MTFGTVIALWLIALSLLVIALYALDCLHEWRLHQLARRERERRPGFIHDHPGRSALGERKRPRR